MMSNVGIELRIYLTKKQNVWLALEKEFSERFNMPVRFNLTNARGFSLEIIGEFKGVLPANVISIAKRQKSTFITTLQLAHLSDRFELLYNDICLLTDQ